MSHSMERRWAMPDSSSARFLRSKRARALLWYAADGLCPNCGDPLPDHWHADHSIPWRIRQRTNVHEMGALCPQCNQHKGGRMFLWRGFQVETREKINVMLASNTLPPALFFDVVPGGGKSTIPLFLTDLIPKYADKILWVSPRDNLARQAAESFDHKLFRDIFKHKGRCRQSGNIANPTKGEIAYSTTYQAIQAAPELHKLELMRHRYILVLDEPHHAWRDGTSLGPYAQALAPLINLAILRVFMSGTFERWDKKPVAFIPYREVAGGTRLALDLPDEWTIRYRRMDGLQEDALVPVYFEGKDAAGRYVDANGEEQRFASFDDEDATLDNGGMLHVALRTEYARQLLQHTVDHWLAHKQHWAPAKMLVVAPFIEVAKVYAQWLREDRGLHAPIAVTGEGSQAKNFISQFRKDPSAQVLVTVGMAYEGLDVPALTHLACLTLYRSKPWIYQCFARVWRKTEGKEAGYIFTPDDPLMREVVEEIKIEQEAWAEQKALPPTGPGGDGPRGDGPVIPQQRSRVVALDSMVVAERVYDLEQELTEQERLELAALQRRKPFLRGLNLLQIKQVIVDWATRPVDHEPMEDDDTPSSLPEISIQDFEIRLRRDIERYCEAVDRAYHSSAYGTTSRELIRHFGKKRGAMSREELCQVWAYLNERYALQSPPVEEVS